MALVTIPKPPPVSAFQGQVVTANSTQLTVHEFGGTLTQIFDGVGFTYAGTSVTGGTVTRVRLVDGATTYFDISGLSYSAVAVAGYVTSGDSAGRSAFLRVGNDTINYQSATGIDTVSQIENLIGSSFNDALTGDIGNNTLTDGLGNDTLLGDAGFDLLDGGHGNDSLSGGLNAGAPTC